ncbi:helix-turn-helix transcriptional regulator [Pseudonocardia sp. HH130630-07]|uniref:helix-turn-helix transcriptional regulator n=1 Tax=Pseudonocardia sp. HH130630-07 TaxID=1690815 RepID=UPI000814E3CC|nr:AraC family transcriptional regulator [Pseudonocardia sp. HH130630-07]ANY06598.1 AraC family transcriptional regulator [Pseudonocardia sp. HH130630-07]
MGRSSGVPLIGLAQAPVPITVGRRSDHGSPGMPRFRGAHAHDFLLLSYVTAGRWATRVDGRHWDLVAGDAFVVAPGAVVAAEEDVAPPGGEIWTVVFPAEAVDPDAAAPLVSWRGHPLLAPFVGNHRGGAQRLTVPATDRPGVLAGLAALEAELAERRDGHADAARAHLTLLLVTLGRLHDDVPAAAVDPLLAGVFATIEERFAEPVSLRDVADALGLTPGHLTTVVGRRTGRTVQQWLTERRMREARRLLAGTDLTVTEIGRRVGYRDAGYFVRRFRTAHGTSPAAWRRR